MQPRYSKYYPGAEPVCDKCAYQIQKEGELRCSMLPWKETLLRWPCMWEGVTPPQKSEEEQCRSQS